MRRAIVWIALTTTVALAVAGRADATVGIEFAVPGSSVVGYGNPVLVAQPGGSITFVNGDNLANGHDVVAFGIYGSDDQPWCAEASHGPRTCPLFWSRLIPFGQATPIRGLDEVKSGKAYPFYCTIHPNDMKGTLIVP